MPVKHITTLKVTIEHGKNTDCHKLFEKLKKKTISIQNIETLTKEIVKTKTIPKFSNEQKTIRHYIKKCLDELTINYDLKYGYETTTLQDQQKFGYPQMVHLRCTIPSKNGLLEFKFHPMNLMRFNVSDSTLIFELKNDNEWAVTRFDWKVDKYDLYEVKEDRHVLYLADVDFKIKFQNLIKTYMECLPCAV